MIVPESEEWSNAEMVRALKRIEQKLDMIPTAYVTREEWKMRNDTVNGRFQDMGREIGDLRGELKSKRVSWTAVGAFVFAGIATALSLIQAVTT